MQIPLTPFPLHPISSVSLPTHSDLTWNCNAFRENRCEVSFPHQVPAARSIGMLQKYTAKRQGLFWVSPLHLVGQSECNNQPINYIFHEYLYGPWQRVVRQLWEVRNVSYRNLFNWVVTFQVLWCSSFCFRQNSMLLCKPLCRAMAGWVRSPSLASTLPFH